MERKLLYTLSPLNFAYNNFYTFYELLIYPALALTQSSPFLVKLDKTIHEIITVSSSTKASEYKFVDMPFKAANHVCFISYPSNCTLNDVSMAL